MTPKQILKSKRIPLSSSVLYLDAEKALENLIEVLKEFDINFDLSNLSKKDIDTLFDNYADCLLTFHPENYHQERGAFWRSKEILMKHGLSMDEIIRAFEFI